MKKVFYDSRIFLLAIFAILALPGHVHSQVTITGPTSACLNEICVYTATSGYSSYDWIVTGGTGTGTTTTNTVEVTWTTSGSGSVYVACTGGNSTLPVTVNPLPVPTISGPNPVCADSCGNVYTTEPGMTAYIWVVSAGGVITAGAGTNAITVCWNTVGAESVAVNYIDANGCSAASPTIFNVTILPLPVVTLTGPTPVCEGSSGNVYVTEAGMTNYTWQKSYGAFVESGGTYTDNTITIRWDLPGAQWVSVNYTDAYGCSSASPTVFPVTVTPVGIQENIPASSKIQIYSEGKNVFVNISNEMPGVITIFNIIGQKITSVPARGKGLNQINLERGGGYFIVLVKCDKGVFAGKVFVQ
jgi:hypothetical protein